MKLIIQALLEFISTLTQKTPSARNAKGQPVKVKRINDIKQWEALRLKC